MKKKKDKMVIYFLIYICKMMVYMMHPIFWFLYGIIGGSLLFIFCTKTPYPNVLNEIGAFTVVYVIIFELLFRKRCQKAYRKNYAELDNIIFEFKEKNREILS